MQNDIKKKGFLQRFKLQMKSMKDLAKYKQPISKEIQHTKTMSAVIYWASLLINMGLIGFGLPAFLNKMLRNDIAKENASSTAYSFNYQFNNYIQNQLFEKFKLNN